MITRVLDLDEETSVATGHGRRRIGACAPAGLGRGDVAVAEQIVRGCGDGLLEGLSLDRPRVGEAQEGMGAHIAADDDGHTPPYRAEHPVVAGTSAHALFGPNRHDRIDGFPLERTIATAQCRARETEVSLIVAPVNGVTRGRQLGCGHAGRRGDGFGEEDVHENDRPHRSR